MSPAASRGGRGRAGAVRRCFRGAALALLLLAAPARGETLEGPDTVVHFPPSARRQAERIAELFRSRRDHAALWLGLDSGGRALVYLVPDVAAMRALAPEAPSWAVAVTTGSTMIFRLDILDRDPANSLDLVLKHETVHFVLGRSPARFPRWFEEGLAVHYAGVAYLEPDTTLERFAAAGNLPRFDEAGRLFEGDAREAALGYKLGQRVVAAFVARFGDGGVRRLVRSLASGLAFPAAFRAATGVPLASFEARWRDEVTPALPFWLFVIVENLDLSLLFFAAILAILGYVRWRLRRERAMSGLGGSPE
ncbi:MAG TPA: hypothetical protein VFY93_17135 [Planctomycetota bacterium]|nr:hypothetical protein [Planctomycetota bacterium]